MAAHKNISTKKNIEEYYTHTMPAAKFFLALYICPGIILCDYCLSHMKKKNMEKFVILCEKVDTSDRR